MSGGRESLAFLRLRRESVQLFACKTFMEKEQDGIVESLFFVPPLCGGEVVLVLTLPLPRALNL
jgi:hypothetical protein